MQHFLVVFNLSLEIAMTKEMTSVLVDITKESDKQSIVFVHQRGEYDVTWKPAIYKVYNKTESIFFV